MTGRRSGKKLKTAALLALTVLFLISAWYLIQRSLPRRKPPEVHTASEDVRVLFTAGTDDIVSVTVDPGDGDEYTLSVSGEKLVLSDRPDRELKESVTRGIMNNVRLIRAEKTVIDTAEERTDLKLFGFDPYRCRAVILTADKKIHTLLIGSQIRGGIPYYYFMFDDDRTIYAGSTDMYSAFSVSRGMLFPAPKISINPDIVDSVSLSGAYGFSMRYTDMGWQMTHPFDYPVNGTFSGGYLKNLSQLSFGRTIAEAADADLEEYGLTEPYLTIDVLIAQSVVTAPVSDGSTVKMDLPARHEILMIGSPCDETSRYALYRDQVVTVSYFFTEALKVPDTEKAVLSVPFQVPIYALTRVSVTAGPEERNYTLAFIEEKDALGHERYDENGEKLYALTVTTNDGPVDADTFAGWMARLQGMKILGPAGNAAAEKEPAASVTLKSALHERVIEFYRVTPSQLLMKVDGTGLYLTDDSILTEIMNAP